MNHDKHCGTCAHFSSRYDPWCGLPGHWSELSEAQRRWIDSIIIDTAQDGLWSVDEPSAWSLGPCPGWKRREP